MILRKRKQQLSFKHCEVIPNKSTLPIDKHTYKEVKNQDKQARMDQTTLFHLIQFNGASWHGASIGSEYQNAIHIVYRHNQHRACLFRAVSKIWEKNKRLHNGQNQTYSFCDVFFDGAKTVFR